jgi:hypothetical protein
MISRFLAVGSICIISLCSGALAARHFSGVPSAPVIEKRDIVISQIQQRGILVVYQVTTELVAPITDNKILPVVNLKVGEQIVILVVQAKTVFTVDLSKAKMTWTDDGVKVTIPQPVAETVLDAAKTRTLFEGAKGLATTENSGDLRDLAISNANKRIPLEINGNQELIVAARESARLTLTHLLSGLGEKVQVEFE